MPEISKRSAELGTENAFVVLGEVEALRRKGREILSFCIGQPDFVTPKNICDAGINAIREGKTGYTPSPGILPLREAVARDFSTSRGIDVKPDDVVVGAGCKCFIGFTIASVTDYGQGHEVIYPAPGYPIYESQIRAQGAVGVPVPLREAREYAFDPDELAKLVTPQTRLIILNTPHNPTGGILGGDVLKAIADIVNKHDQIWLYADEVYCKLVYDKPFESIASLPGMLERTVIADGSSKAWSMTGWRIGYAANSKLAPYFATWVTNEQACAGHMNQFAAMEALAGPQDETERMRKIFHERRDLIVDLLNKVPGVSCLKPGGAFYVWPNVTETCKMVGAENSEVLRKRILDEASVAVLSDIHFGTPPKGEGQHLRFSYAASTEEIRKGVETISQWVTRNKR